MGQLKGMLSMLKQQWKLPLCMVSEEETPWHNVPLPPPPTVLEQAPVLRGGAAPLPPPPAGPPPPPADETARPCPKQQIWSRREAERASRRDRPRGGAKRSYYAQKYGGGSAKGARR